MKVRLPSYSKYNAKRAEVDGIKFPSQKEAKRYHTLKHLRDQGDVLFFLRQIPFDLPGGVKYVLDFLIFWASGEVVFEDVKGFKTDIYKLKKKQVESLYNIEIQEI